MFRKYNKYKINWVYKSSDETDSKIGVIRNRI